MKKIGMILGGFLFVGSLWAEDFPPSVDSADFEKTFGAESGISTEDKNSTDEDRMKIGGTLAIDVSETGVGSGDTFKNLNTFWLYADAKLRNDIRAYVKTKSLLTVPSAGDSETFATSLEEMKLFFNTENFVFFTLGKQKIKWGSSKFWNPTDLVNDTKRDLLYTDDRRSGVTLLKTHVPVGASNFYYVTGFDGANRMAELSHFGRMELPLGPSELSLTAGKKYGKNSVFGADLSVGVLDFDLYSEVAYSKGSNATFYGPTGSFHLNDQNTLNWTAGLSYEVKYSDSDTVSFALEYFNNADGYDSKDSYAYVVANQAYVPFYLSEQYLLFNVWLAEPGSWNDTVFSFSTIANLTDQTYLTKFNVTLTLMQDLVWDIGLGYRLGDVLGELRYGDQKYQVESRLAVQF